MNRILIVVSFLVGFAIGALLFYPSQETKNLQKEESKQEEWTCAMHPQVRQKTPGKCPLCGMDLVLVGSQTENPYRLVMSAQAARLANIQTEKVTYRHPEKIIYLNGKVQANEKTLYRQTAHVAGRIEQLYLNTTGESIHKGQMLASIYS
ncbi:MAG: heavy metal-binding domain-containing protein, partial [Flammeovirgaceae bacterium]|nr:heavy metal-binding domain-containing protein [Flammeovirgaceae bacterium]